MFTEKAFRDLDAHNHKKSMAVMPGYCIQSGFVGIALVLCAGLLAGGDVSLPAGGTPASKIEMTTIPLTAIKQVYICDKTGNVTLSASSQAKDVTMEVRKTVYVQHAADASPKFQAMTVSTQNITKSSCDWLPKQGDGSTLVVSANTPDDGNLLKGEQRDGIHLTIVFPSSMVAAAAAVSVRVEAGNNITLSGFAGKLTLLSTAGNVQAENMSLAASSMLHAQAGNIVFTGSLSGSPIQDLLQSDSGDISVTLPATTNVSVDASAPTGNIEDTFSPTSVNQGVVGATIKGPLNPSRGVITPGLLKLMAFTGDIVINKA